MSKDSLHIEATGEDARRILFGSTAEPASDSAELKGWFIDLPHDPSELFHPQDNPGGAWPGLFHPQDNPGGAWPGLMNDANLTLQDGWRRYQIIVGEEV